MKQTNPKLSSPHARRIQASSLLFGLVLLLYQAPCGLGQCGSQIGKISNPQAEYAYYATALATDGTVMVVGAPGANVANGLGCAYVYRQTLGTWILEATLAAPPTEGSNYFAGAVALSENLIVVGATNATGVGEYTGAAYVFRYNGTSWGYEAKLIAADGQNNDLFGVCLAARDDVIVVGAYYHGDGGAAYIFRYDGTQWNAEQELVLDGVGGEFGRGILIDDGALAIANPSEKIGIYSHAGAVYIFRHGSGGWLQEAHLMAPDPQTDAYFGEAIAFQNGVLAASAPSATGQRLYTGAVYIFSKDGQGWAERDTLTVQDAPEGYEFGLSVATDGSRVAAAAIFDTNTAGTAAGAIFTYTAPDGHWTLEDKLIPGDSQTDTANLGVCLGLFDQTVVAGAPGADNWGAVYLFDAISPGIGTQPTSLSVDAPAAATFTVVSYPTSQLVYQWRRDGIPLNDGVNISGATTATLTISPTSLADQGSYDVIVTNPCASGTSAAATLIVIGCPIVGCECLDTNHDCAIDLLDLSAVLAHYAGSGPGDCLYPFGYIDLEDIANMLAHFGQSCQ